MISAVESRQQDPRTSANWPGARSDWLEPNMSERICVVEECSQPSWRWYSLCGRHQRRLDRYGDPCAGAAYQNDHEARFWAKVDRFSRTVDEIRADLTGIPRVRWDGQSSETQRTARYMSELVCATDYKMPGHTSVRLDNAPISYTDPHGRGIVRAVNRLYLRAFGLA